MTRISGNILNVITYNTGDFLASTVPPGSTQLPLTFAFDFKEGGGEAQIVETDQVVVYTGFDPDTQVLYLDATTPLGASAFEGDKVEVLPYSLEKRAFVEIDEGMEPVNVRVPHNLQALLEDGIRSEASGYESVSIESDGSEWVIKEIYGKPAKISTSALPQIPSELMADGIPPVASPGVTVTPLGVGALQGRWSAAAQPDLHDPVIYDVYVSATSPVVADAEHFLTSTAGTSQSFARVPVGGVWVPVSTSEPSYMAVWARDTDGLAPTLGGEGGGIPVKADIDQLNVSQLNANTIETLALWAANVNADFVFANNRIQIGDATGSHIVLDPAQGLILYATNGTTPVVTLDMTAAQLSEFTGKINTNQLAVFESVEIHGLFSKIMSAAYMTIASSTISAPSSPPTLTQSTNTMTWPALPAGFAEYGLYWATNKWRRLLYNSSTYETRVEHISSVGASVSSVTLTSEAADRGAYGIVDDGTYFYCLRRDSAAAGSGNFYLKKYNYNGTVVADTGGTSSLTWNASYGFAVNYGASSTEFVRSDASNILHVVDVGNKLIRRFNTSGVFQGWTIIPATLNSVNGMDVDASGNYYLTDDNSKVYKVDSSGTIVWTSGAFGTGNGQFNLPRGIRLDGSGNIYVADWGNNRVQKLNSSGVYQSQFGSTGTGNGQFNLPSRINFDGSGNIYVSDTGNDRVQKFNSSGVYQSMLTGAVLNYPLDIEFDGSGNIYLADTQNYTIQKFNSSGVWVSNFVYAFDEDYGGPADIALDTSGNFYVTIDSQDDTYVYKFNSSGVFQSSFLAEGGAFNVDAGMDDPSAVTISPSGDIWVADTYAHRIKKFNSAGVFQADYGGWGTGNSQFRYPRGIAFDSSGNIYVSDEANVRKFNSSMTFVSKWGDAAGATGTSTGHFNQPRGMVVDTTDTYIYIADHFNDRVMKYTVGGTYNATIGGYGSGNGQFIGPSDVSLSPSGHLYVVDEYLDRVQKLTTTGTYVSKFGTSGSSNGQFSSPNGIYIDAGGNIYVSDMLNERVQKFNSSHTYQAQYGSEGTGNGQYGSAMIADVTFDASGNMYTLEMGPNARIQKFVGAYPALANTVANEVSPTIRTYPALGYDGTNLLIGVVDNTSMDLDNSTGAGVALYAKTDLEFTGTYYKVSGDIMANQPTTFIGKGAFDYGGNRVVIGTPSAMRVYTYSGTTLTADTTNPTFTFDGGIKAAGWDGTNFYSIADTTVARRYSTFLGASAAQRKFWTQYQWENGATQGTTPSPKASFDLLDRRWLNITVPSPGAGTGYTRIFTGNGSSSPANSAMYGLAGVLAAAGTVQTATVLGSGTNPKTVADIPTGAAGVFEAEVGSFSVNGNSIGAWHEKMATPRMFANTTGGQSAPNSTTTFTTINFLLSNLHSHASANYWSFNDTTHELTLVKEGFWRFDVALEWANNSGGERLLEIYNVTTASRLTITRNAARDTGGVNDGRHTNQISKTFYIPANTVLRFGARQSSGGSINIEGGASDLGTSLSVVWEGPAI